jgi:hypothetical protein
MMRVSLTLDPVDVDLVDRLARLEGSNRSAEVRSVLAQLRPVLQQTVETFEAALGARDALTRAAAEASAEEFETIQVELERLQLMYAGVLSRIEGAAAADPRRSNHGGHTPTPTPDPTPPGTES